MDNEVNDMDTNNELLSNVDAAWTGDEPLADQPVETPAPAPADQPGEPPADQPAGDGQDAQAPDAQGGQAQADQPELFTLRNREEVRQVTREEITALAQKGWDYDTVRQERDQLRQYRQEAGPALELVKSYAQRNHMSVPEYLDYCRKQELMSGGMSEQGAAERLTLEKERSDLDRQRSELDERQRQQDNQRRQAEEQAQARQRDIQAFYRAYPGVDPKTIPQAVWDAVREGQSLTNAYTMHENRRLQAELVAERQNKHNSAASPGSLGGEGADSKASLIAQYWDEAE